MARNRELYVSDADADVVEKFAARAKKTGSSFSAEVARLIRRSEAARKDGK